LRRVFYFLAPEGDEKLNKSKESKDKRPPTLIDEATLAGIFIAKHHKVIPQIDEHNHVRYAVYGDVEKSLQEIYSNAPVGTLDALNGVKTARAMIYALRKGGHHG
jgi:hypothetical protein